MITDITILIQIKIINYSRLYNIILYKYKLSLSQYITIAFIKLTQVISNS